MAAGGHAPHVQLGAEPDPPNEEGGEWGGKGVPPKKTELLFPEEAGMWAGLARATDGHHGHRQVLGTELTRGQVSDPGVLVIRVAQATSRSLGIQSPAWMRGSDH